MAENSSKPENLFDQVRVNNERLDDIELLLTGRPQWGQPGIIAILREIQETQANQKTKITLLLIAMTLLLLICLAILLGLALALRVGM